MRRAVVILAIAAACGVPGQALAFHRGFVPAPTCAESANAGGANPTARAAIREHNPAQGDALPLPLAGTPSQAGETPAEQNCAQDAPPWYPQARVGGPSLCPPGAGPTDR